MHRCMWHTKYKQHILYPRRYWIALKSILSRIFTVDWKFDNMYACACLSQVRSLQFSGCRLFMCYIFVLCTIFYLYKAIVFSFEMFYIVKSGPFMADYAVYGFCSWLKARVRWPIFVNFCVILVSRGELSYWQSYHIFFFICEVKQEHRFQWNPILKV